MPDQDKSKQQLIEELAEMRQREAQRRSAAADPPVFVAITELEQRVKQRTAELAEANEDLDIFRKFVEASGEGFGMTDLDGRIAYANSTVARLFGEERPENMVGKNIAAYYTEEYSQRRKEEMIPCLLRVGHWHVETTILPRAQETAHDFAKHVPDSRRRRESSSRRRGDTRRHRTQAGRRIAPP